MPSTEAPQYKPSSTTGAPESEPPKSKLPPWIFAGFKSRRTLKTWIRCSMVLASAIVMLVCNKTLANMGQAGFFCAIVAVMLPPLLPFSLYLFVAFTLILGMMLGWAWSCAAMASGLNVRSASLLLQQEKAAQAAMLPGVSSTAQLETFIFHGMFLDPRVSAVYGAFLFIGTFLTGLMRAYLPKLTLCAIFGTIVIDVMASYGPLFPTQQYTLAKMFVIPALYYVAMALASLIFIFPESMNHSWLTSLNQTVLAPMTAMLKTQSEALKLNPTDHVAWADLTQQSKNLRRGIIPAILNLINQVTFVDLEVSVGKLGPADIKRIAGELKILAARASGLMCFQLSVHEVNQSDKETFDSTDRFSLHRRRLVEREQRHGQGLVDLIPILHDASEVLRTECLQSAEALQGWINESNSKRWTHFFFSFDKTKYQSHHDALVERQAALEAAIAQFKAKERSQLLQPFKRFFDPETRRLLDTQHENKPAARSLFVCFVFADTLVAFAEALLKLMSIIVELDAKRPRPRVWFPSGFGKLVRKIKGVGIADSLDPIGMGTAKDPTKFVEPSQSVDSFDDDHAEELNTTTFRRNPDALPPTTVFGKFFLTLGNFLAFFTTDEAIFALRHAIVSVALWVPAVCVSTAWFNYRYKGLWAMIMAQTGLGVYAGDQIAAFVLRISGTLLGLLLGMAVWYISSGNGDGNPYGLVVTTTVFVSPLIYMRMVAPPQFTPFYLITAVTIVFLVGYSWIDEHLALVANSGIGDALAWKRSLLVIIGFTAGFIVMLFPRPSSSRLLVRRTIAASIDEVSSMLAGEVEAFLAEDRHAQRQAETDSSSDGDNEEGFLRLKERRMQILGQKFLAAGNRLLTLLPSLTTAKLEPGLRGKWPADLYQQLYDNQASLTFYLALLASALNRLDSRWCEILVHSTPLLNPNFLPDVFATLTILSRSLSTGQPLPASLPKLRDRLIYHDRYMAAQKDGNRYQPSVKHQPKSLGDETDAMMAMEIEALGENGHVDSAHVGVGEMTFDILEDDHLPVHSTAIVALANIYRLIDRSTSIVRQLCGEVGLYGFDNLREEYMNMEEKSERRGRSNVPGLAKADRESAINANATDQNA